MENSRFKTDKEKATAVTNPLLKYMQKPTRGQAIKAKCAECVGCSPDHLEPGYRATIRDCTSKTCPLHPFRPYQKGNKDED